MLPAGIHYDRLDGRLRGHPAGRTLIGVALR